MTIMSVCFFKVNIVVLSLATMLDMTTAARAFNEGDVANMADRQGKSVRTKDFRRSILFRGKNLTVDRVIAWFIS